MKERPILFSAPMVRAILAGTKTQTRRAIKPVGNDEGFVLQDYGDGPWPYRSEDGESGFYRDSHGYDVEERIKCPYGQPGDRLWVRETWGYFDPDGSGHDFDEKNDDGGHGPCRVYTPEMMQEGHPLREFWRRRIAYKANWKDGRYGTGVDGPTRWRPSIHMPRWASRITLEVTGVKVERLQDISEQDAMAEGIVNAGDGNGYQLADTSHYAGTASESYASLWESINGPGSWDANPWVWCVSFLRVSPNTQTACNR